ncbi:MAG: hypothetical protein RLZZ543_124 [Bacteroidota bacterium]
MRITTKTIALLLAAGLFQTMQAQDEKKVTFTGMARGLYYGDKLTQDSSEPDTVTAPKLNSGHVMVDLGVNIRPNKNTEILGMVRVRNDYGGFWGSGVTFDVRQLYVKGLIGGIFKYQLGDFNYRMSRYTFWNYDQEVISQQPAIFRQQTDVINYEHFYDNDNSRRQQGASLGFALVFKKFVKELQVNSVTTRVRASDFAQIDDRLFSGFNMQLVQSKYLNLGFNYANLYDVSGTSKNNVGLRNPVMTGTVQAAYIFKNYEAKLDGEFGKSRTFYQNSTIAPDWNGKFLDFSLKLSQSKWGVHLTGNAIQIGSAFRSPGAQTKRIDFAQQALAYTRITNNQELRPFTMLDLMRESSFYVLQLRPYLMDFAPKYDNITPYGDATPNRQGMIVRLRYEKKYSPITAEFAHYALQEMRGEGTLNPRNFTRNQFQADVKVNEYFKNWKKRFNVSFNYRSDQTTREGEELVRGVDLRTNVLSTGFEIEVLPSFDLMFGMQQLNYQGFDYTAVRNNFSEIFNFNEYEVDGKETMLAYGARYRFSEKTFISAQMSQFNTQNKLSTLPAYDLNQFMLLFQMKF